MAQIPCPVEGRCLPGPPQMMMMMMFIFSFFVSWRVAGENFFSPLTLEAKMLFVVPASSLEYQYVARPQIVPGELLVNGTCNSMPGWCARVNTATVTCLLAILA